MPYRLTTLAVVLIGTFAHAGEPIRVHPKNPRYFEWSGKPLAIVTSAEHYGAVLNLDFDYEKYLDTLKADGMPLTRIFSGSYVEPAGAFGIERNVLAPAAGRFLAPWKRSDTPGYAGGGNKFDLDAWDPEYLKRLKAFLTAAGKRGIVVELTLFCSTYTPRQWAIHPFNPDNTVTKLTHTDWRTLHTPDNGNALEHQLKLTRYLVKELNGFDNLVFEIQNEPWADQHDLGEVLLPFWVERKAYPNRVEVTKPVSVKWQGLIAAAVRDEEKAMPKKHLLFQNVANFRLAIDPKRDLAGGVSAVHFHYAFPEAAAWNEPLKMPICCDETGFCGPDDEPYRKQAWAFLMAGGGLWNHLDYSFTVGKEDGSDRQSKSPGGGGPALRKQLRVLHEFINSFDLAELAPDREAVAKSPGAAAQCLSVPGKEYAVYLRGRGPTDLTLKLPAGAYTGEWIEVTTGKVLATTPVTGPITSPNYADEIALRVKKNR
jgi:hypothetical protein